MDICIVRINLEKLEVDGKCIMYLRIILDLQYLRESYFAAALQGSQTFSHEIESLGARLPSCF